MFNYVGLWFLVLPRIYRGLISTFYVSGGKILPGWIFEISVDESGTLISLSFDINKSFDFKLSVFIY